MPKLADIRDSRVFRRKASEVLWKRGPVILESNEDSQLLSVHAQFPNIVPETELDVDPTNWECQWKEYLAFDRQQAQRLAIFVDSEALQLEMNSLRYRNGYWSLWRPFHRMRLVRSHSYRLRLWWYGSTSLCIHKSLLLYHQPREPSESYVPDFPIKLVRNLINRSGTQTEDLTHDLIYLRVGGAF
jgi:hypothetical protein